jgi:hypothetical protein
MRLYMKFRQTELPSLAAAKASISAATAYRFEHDHRLPSDHQQIRSRRRPDPLADFFESEIVPMLKAAPELRAVAIFEEMQRRHPGLSSGVRRTLERRIRSWRALHGANQEMIFRQVHEPGRMGKAGQGSAGVAGGMPDEGCRILLIWPTSASPSLVSGSIIGSTISSWSTRASSMRTSFSAAKAMWRLPRAAKRVVGTRRCTARTPQRQPFSGIP